MLEQLIVIIHVMAAISVVALILLQQGKGADMGASFGSGASQTVLGVQGGGNLLTHATAILTTVFFLTSLSLGYYAKQKSMVNTDDIIIEQPVEQPGSVKSAAPVAKTVTVENVKVEQNTAPAEAKVAAPQAPVVAPAVSAPAPAEAPKPAEIPE